MMQEELKANENTLGDNLLKFVPNTMKPLFGQLPLSKFDTDKPKNEPYMINKLIEE